MSDFPASQTTQSVVEQDDALLERISRGDIRAFETLFVRYHQRLVQFGSEFTGSDIVADEVVVDIFMAIWDGRNSLRIQPGHVTEYLYVAVRNRALNVVRTTQRRAKIADTFSRETHVPGMAQDTFDILERLYTEDVTRALETAIAALPERSRIAVRLRWQQQMSVAQIAVILGMTPGAVQMTLSRGLKVLRHILEHFPL